MPLTNAGRNHFAAATLAEGPPTPFNNANAHIGVGDSSTAFNVNQTDLQAAVNKVRVGMDPGFPTLNANAMAFQSTFGTAVANFTWAEWATFNASSAGVMLNRKVESNGTKQSGQIWIFGSILTIGIGS